MLVVAMLTQQMQCYCYCMLNYSKTQYNVNTR